MSRFRPDTYFKIRSVLKMFPPSIPISRHSVSGVHYHCHGLSVSRHPLLCKLEVVTSCLSSPTIFFFPVSNTELAVAAPNNIFLSLVRRAESTSFTWISVLQAWGLNYFLNLCTFPFDMYWNNEHVRKFFQGWSISPEKMGVLPTITGNLLEGRGGSKEFQSQ